MSSVILMGGLGVLGVEDYIKKQVHIIIIYILGVCGVMLHLIYKDITTANMIGGSMVGVFVYVLSLITKEKIGKADGLLFITTGIYLGFWDNSVLLLCSCVIAVAFGLVFIRITQREKNYQLPFIPFVALAYMLLITIRFLSG